MTRATRLRIAVTALAAAALVTAGCSSPEATPDGPVIGTSPAATPSAAAPSTTPQTPAGDPPTGGGGNGGGGNPDRCTTAELSVSFGEGDAGAGSMFLPLLLTNTGDRACELTGFPGVSYVTGDSGEQVGPAAAMDGERGGPVPLAVGDAAVAQLRLVNVANYDAAVCMPTPVRGLRIYPPGDTASLFAPLETTGCAGTPPGNQLSVQTLKPS